MKRGWGFDHIMTKKFEKRASSDVGFIFTAFDLRRLINIIGVTQLMNQLTTNPLITFVKPHLNRYIRVFKASLITFLSINTLSNPVFIKPLLLRNK